MAGMRLQEQVSEPNHRFDGPAGLFTHRIGVSWAECDPAQIAYTGSIPNYALRAVEALCYRVIGAGFFELNVDHGIGTPFVHLAVDFKAPVTPRHPLEVGVAITRLGRASLTFRADGRQAGGLCFTGTLTSAYVAAARMKTIPIPAGIRANLATYAEGQGEPFENAA